MDTRNSQEDGFEDLRHAPQLLENDVSQDNASEDFGRSPQLLENDNDEIPELADKELMALMARAVALVGTAKRQEVTLSEADRNVESDSNSNLHLTRIVVRRSITKLCGEFLTKIGLPSTPYHQEVVYDVMMTELQSLGLVDPQTTTSVPLEPATSATLKDIPDRASLIDCLGDQLAQHYDGNPDKEGIEDIISLARQVISATPTTQPDRADRLSILSIHLFSQHDLIGSIDSLDESISLIRQALISSQDNPNRINWLHNLSMYLSTRFEWKGDLADLEDATSFAHQAVLDTPISHPLHMGILNNLAILHKHRYMRLRDMESLEESVSLGRRVVEATPEDRPDRPAWLNNLSVYLSLRYRETMDRGDLDESMDYAYRAVAATPKDHPDRACYLHDLSMLLSQRYKQTGDLEILEEAISYSMEAVDLTPEGHPTKAGRLIQLGERYLQLLSKCDDADSWSETYVLGTMMVTKGFDCSSSVPLLRVYCARTVIRLLVRISSWDEAARVAQEVVSLLPSFCGRYLRRQDQQYAILQASGLAADACSLSLKTGNVELALQQIEFGRGLILSYLIDSRSDLSALKRSHPDLAKEFDRLRLKISQPMDNREPSWSNEDYGTEDDRRVANSQFDECLNRIRRQKGYERFLIQPTIQELTQAAEEGPIVVVNVTDISSDAIIVTQSGVRRIELPDMAPSKATFLSQAFGRFRSTYKDDNEQIRDIHIQTDTATKCSATFLTQLWKCCVAPILEDLTEELSPTTETPRIWWIGTGVASSLPFHAAGDYSDNASKDSNVLSRAASSYTPTIKSLVHARLCLAGKDSTQDERPSVLLVAMSETPGHNSLPGVTAETGDIQQAVGNVYTVNTLNQPSAKQVMTHMKESDIVHFACHGSSDPLDPSSSHLLLQTDRTAVAEVEKLTLQEISDSQSIGRARVAYLSACSTAEIKAKKFADEGLHIVGAFQVAGFGHVIGSMWSADDSTSALVAKLFYQGLIKANTGQITNRGVAEALRAAILAVSRDRDPSLWAPYVHSGA